MKAAISLSDVRFAGRHRCPRCRMPLFASEIDCPTCGLQIVYINDQDEVMIEMVDIIDPDDLSDPAVVEYRKSLGIEAAGGMHLPNHLPTIGVRAMISRASDGKYIVGFSNLVALDGIARRTT